MYLFFTAIAYAEPFKVGLILPLSGSVAEFGDAVKNGVDLFKADYPNNNLTFFYEDSRYDGPTSISAFNKLIGSDKVDIVYTWGSAPSAVIAPIAEFKKFPAVLMSGDKEIVKDKKFSIDFSNDLEEFSKVELEELRRKGHKKFAIVKSEIQYLETLVKGLKDNLKKDESLEILESFQPGVQVGFQSTLTKLKLNLKKNRYDAVGVFLTNGQLSSFYRKMHDQDISIPTFGSDFFDSSTERRESGTSMIGGIWTTLGITEKFESKYKNRYNKKDQIGFAAGAYDLATLLNDQFPKTDENNKKALS